VDVRRHGVGLVLRQPIDCSGGVEMTRVEGSRLITTPVRHLNAADDGCPSLVGTFGARASASSHLRPVGRAEMTRVAVIRVEMMRCEVRAG
jgi:hypothetical protein